MFRIVFSVAALVTLTACSDTSREANPGVADTSSRRRLRRHCPCRTISTVSARTMAF